MIGLGTHSRRIGHALPHQVALGLRRHRLGRRQGGVSALLVSQKPPQIHSASTLRSAGPQRLPQDRLPRRHRHARRVERFTPGPRTRAASELLHPLLRGTTPPQKRGFEALLKATVDLARDAGILSGRSKEVALDSTGYEAGHTSEYYGRRSGLKKSHFPKLTAICDTRSHIYLSGLADQGPKPDSTEFRSTVLLGYSVQPFDVLFADAGYDGESHHVLIRERLGAISIIPARVGRPSSRPPRGRYRRQMASQFPKKRYGQRWQLESCFSQDKRRFGSSVEGRSYWTRCRKLHLRLLVHNVAILLCLWIGQAAEAA